MKPLRTWMRCGAMAYIAAVLAGCAALTYEAKTPADIGGVQHMGTDYNIADFYVNGASGQNVGRGGGGGGRSCCVILPNKWRPGLVAEVRWIVNDWSKVTEAEYNNEDYRHLGGQRYIATVPVEQYDKVGTLFVHFFAGGKVRVVVSNIGPGFPDRRNGHPIAWNDPHAADSATVGTAVKALFTEAELAEIDKRRAATAKWR